MGPGRGMGCGLDHIADRSFLATPLKERAGDRMDMYELENIFDTAMDSLSEVNPQEASILFGATRKSNNGSATFPVIAAAHHLDTLNDSPVEFATLVLSLMRSVKKMCRKVAGQKRGEDLFEFCATRAVRMREEEGVRATHIDRSGLQR